MLIGPTTTNPLFLTVFEFQGTTESLALTQRATAAFDHALFTGRDRFQAHADACLGRTAVARIGNDMDPPPSVAVLFDSFLAQGQEAQAAGRYRDAFYAYERAIALPDHRRPVVRYLYASAIFRDGRDSKQAEYVLTLARELERDLAGRSLAPLERALQAFVDRLITDALGVLEEPEEGEVFYFRSLDRLKALCPPRELADALEFFASMIPGVTAQRVDPETKKLLPPKPPPSEIDAGGKALIDMFQIAMKAGIWCVSFYQEAGHWPAVLITSGGLNHHFEESKNHRARAKLDFELGLHHHSGAHFPEALKNYESALEFLKKAGDDGTPAAGASYESSHWSPMLRLLADLCSAALNQESAHVPTDKAFNDEIVRIRNAPRRGFSLAMATEMSIYLGMQLLHRKSLVPARQALELGAELLMEHADQRVERETGRGLDDAAPEKIAKALLHGKGAGGLAYYLRRQFIVSHGHGLIDKQAAAEDAARADEWLKSAEKYFHRALGDQLKLMYLKMAENHGAFVLLGRLWLRYAESVLSAKPDLEAARNAKKEILNLLRRSVPEFADFEKRPEVAAVLSELESLEKPATPSAMN